MALDPPLNFVDVLTVQGAQRLLNDKKAELDQAAGNAAQASAQWPALKQEVQGALGDVADSLAATAQAQATLEAQAQAFVRDAEVTPGTRTGFSGLRVYLPDKPTMPAALTLTRTGTGARLTWIVVALDATAQVVQYRDTALGAAPGPWVDLVTLGPATTTYDDAVSPSITRDYRLASIRQGVRSLYTPTVTLPQDLPANMLGVWDALGNLTDISGRGVALANTGVTVNAQGWTFGGTSYLDGGDIFSPAVTGGLYICLPVTILDGNPAVVQYMISKQLAGGAVGGEFSLYYNGVSLRAQAVQGTAPTVEAGGPTGALPANSPRFVEAFWTPSSVSISTDNSAKATTPASLAARNPAIPFRIGTRSDGVTGIKMTVHGLYVMANPTEAERALIRAHAVRVNASRPTPVTLPSV